MHPDRQEELRKRVVRAAGEALAQKQYVSAIDVLTGTGLLAPANVEAWRKGRWAQEKGLKPSETGYTRSARSGTVDLRFSKSGDPGVERNYRTHYVSPALSERKQEKLKQKLSNPTKPVATEILRDSACSKCGAELARGSFLVMDVEQPLCRPWVGKG